MSTNMGCFKPEPSMANWLNAADTQTCQAMLSMYLYRCLLFNFTSLQILRRLSLRHRILRHLVEGSGTFPDVTISCFFLVRVMGEERLLGHKRPCFPCCTGNFSRCCGCSWSCSAGQYMGCMARPAICPCSTPPCPTLPCPFTCPACDPACLVYRLPHLSSIPRSSA